MLQHHKGKVPHSVKTILIVFTEWGTSASSTQGVKTPCVLDAELDCFEDFELKKKNWANKDGPILVI